MSYWSALDRARLGDAGDAEPRPRHVFEEDGWSTDGIFEQALEIDTPEAALVPRADAPQASVAGTRVTAATADGRDPEPAPEIGRTPMPEPIERRETAAAAIDDRSAEPTARDVEPPMPEAAALREAERAPAKPDPEPIRAEASERVERRVLVEHREILTEAAPRPRPMAPYLAAEPAELQAEPILRVMASPAPPPEAERAEDALASAPPRTLAPLTVHIDRIEIRIDPPALPVPAPVAVARPAAPIALADYLATRSGRA